jgi:thiol:disulfide interchange protein DsbD
MKRLWTALLLILCLVAPAVGQDRVRLSAELNYDRLQPGSQAVVAIVMDIADGFHVQSRTPLDETLIRLDIIPAKNDVAKIHEPIYPPGTIKTYPALGELSIYSGRVIFYVPVEIPADAVPAPITIEGNVRLQVCDDQVCFAPTRMPFRVETEIVPTATPIAPRAEVANLFSDFDPRTWATINSGTAAPNDVAPPDTTGATSPTNATVANRVWGLDLSRGGLVFVVAFAAGLVLNVMPCVLPVLPLKAMGFYEAAQHNRARCFALGIAFSVGMLAAFAIVSIPVVVLKSIGWGQMFSNVYFAGGMALLLVGVALMSFGLFELILPSRVYALEASHSTFTGNFLWGIFTAILSTPCTFGALATVLAIALTMPTWVGVLVVLTVGLGMAVPYVLLSAFPQLAARVPRGGPLGGLIKQSMGWIMLATAIFFASPLLPQGLRGDARWWMIFGVIVVGAVYTIVRVILLGRSKSGRPVTGRAVGSVIAICIAAVVGTFFLVSYITRPTGEWLAFSDTVLQAERNKGVVVVKFTADWCTNCKVVETNVYGDEDTRDELIRRRVVLVKSDLSAEDAPGWSLLRELNPAGSIPLTAVYLPGEDNPRILNGIYSREVLLQTIEK